MNAQNEQDKVEWLTCAESFLYFCGNYIQIYDAVTGEWVPFVLWQGQVGVARTLLNNLLVVILKARQLGMTWLVLAFALWLMLFSPAATILLFSKRDDEAIELLDFRLKGMYERLPAFLKCQDVLTSNSHEWELSNGSRALSFPTTGGRSYTATMVVVDEADFIPDLGAVISATQPTIDAGGRMVVLSSANKLTPLSRFKTLFRAAIAKTVSYVAVFLAWNVAPWRTPEWYAQKRADAERLDELDDLNKEYPTTWAEALAPAAKDKRIRYAWIEQCYYELDLLPENRKRNLESTAPAIEGLTLYRLPEPGKKYVLGADPAEGNPSSDDSAFDVLERESGEQVATLAGKFQPEIFAAHMDVIGTFFNKADVLPERNNHGHTVIVWLREHSKLKILKAQDDKDGWNTTALSKSLLYDNATTMLREQETVLHNFETVTQLSLIEGATLSAPKEMHDDRATSLVLALIARLLKAPEPRIR